jgi:hypothetical protein
MIDSISSNNPIASPMARNPIAAADQTPANPVKLPAPNADVVQLSNSAQAKLLKQQGFDIAQIAIELGLDEKTVTSYLPTVTTKE